MPKRKEALSQHFVQDCEFFIIATAISEMFDSHIWKKSSVVAQDILHRSL